MRPVLSITPRKVVVPFAVGGCTLPPGVHVTPCLYLAHRRPELWPDPTAFRPERFLDGAPRATLAAVRRRRAPLRRRRVRDDGAARGAARGRAPLRARARPAGGRADAPPRRDADARRAAARVVPLASSASHDVAVLPPQPHDRQAARSARRRWRPSCARRRRRGRPASAARRPRRGRAARPRRAPAALVTRKLARAEDDGYRNHARPRPARDRRRRAARGRAADRRGAARAARPYEAVATEPDREQATWLAFLLALVGPDGPELPGRGRGRRAAVRGRRAARACRPAQARAVAAYRQWAARAGSQAAGFTGEADWSPRRRFARVFERLALPGLGRAPRFELLDDARRRRPLRARARRARGSASRTTRRRRPPSACCCRATRCCSSGARATSRRACDVPLAALDRGFALWGDPGTEIEPADELAGRDALRARPAVSARARGGRAAASSLMRARLPRPGGARALPARPARRMTRGRGSSGAGRSPSSTSTRAPGRRGSRCRCCSRRRSRWPATRGRPSCGW